MGMVGGGAMDTLDHEPRHWGGQDENPKCPSAGEGSDLTKASSGFYWGQDKGISPGGESKRILGHSRVGTCRGLSYDGFNLALSEEDLLRTCNPESTAL